MQNKHCCLFTLFKLQMFTFWKNKNIFLQLPCSTRTHNFKKKPNKQMLCLPQILLGKLPIYQERRDLSTKLSGHVANMAFLLMRGKMHFRGQ